MVFIDSNIPMYLVGAAHPNKDAARRLLEQCIDRGERQVADAEVPQEILHRYVAINRGDAIQPAFNELLKTQPAKRAVAGNGTPKTRGAASTRSSGW